MDILVEFGIPSNPFHQTVDNTDPQVPSVGLILLVQVGNFHMGLMGHGCNLHHYYHSCQQKTGTSSTTRMTPDEVVLRTALWDPSADGQRVFWSPDMPLRKR